MLSNARPKILVVDDEAPIRNFLRRALEPVAAEVGEAANATEALEAIESRDFDLILSDLVMPQGNGLELLAMSQASQWDVAFLLMSGRADLAQVVEALRLQAADFLIKPFTVAELLEAVRRGYRRVRAQRELRTRYAFLEAGLQRRTRDLESALRYVETNYEATLEALVAALDAREQETCRHSFRVRGYTVYLARLVGYPPAQLPVLERGALLHDIGKIAVSDSILLKPGKLTDAEWLEMRKHSVAGEQILNRVSFLRASAPIVRHHHERYDGRGYPDGLAAEAIPLGSRLFAFADTLDAMTTNRCYRQAPGFDAAYREIARCAGAQFDPGIADIFLCVPIDAWIELQETTPESQPTDSSVVVPVH
jgi:putative nucleotidyltransferase with HDIG domain